MPECRVRELWIYPVKSCRGIQVQSFQVDDYGPIYDREWVLVDETNKFITQREFGILAQVIPTLASDRLHLKFGDDEVSVPLQASLSDSGAAAAAEQVQVWTAQLQAFPESQEAHEFFTGILKKPVRLMRYLKKPQRSVGQEIQAQTRFTDRFPFHVVHQEIVDQLQKDSEMKNLTAKAFRANIILENFGGDEESLLEMKIGEIQLSGGLPTARCVITTLDPETGEKLGAEPLKHLAKTRRRENKVLFGMHYVHRNGGIISVGDIVLI